MAQAQHNIVGAVLAAHNNVSAQYRQQGAVTVASSNVSARRGWHGKAMARQCTA